MTTRRIIACILLPAVLLVLPLTTAVAQQQPPPLEPGARVRVTAPDLGISKQVATFEAVRGDTLVVLAESRMFCPLASVTRLDVYGGQKSNTLKGMGYGLLIGAGVGVLVGAVVPCRDALDFSYESDCVKIGGAAGAVVGLLVGTTVGLLNKTDRWEEVPLDQIRVSFLPRRDGFALGMSVAF